MSKNVDAPNVSYNGSSDGDSYLSLISTDERLSKSGDISTWIVDSGCTSHITFDRLFFAPYEKIFRVGVKLGNNEKDSVVGCGHVILSVRGEGNLKKVELENVLYVPSFEHSLLYVKLMDKKGWRRRFKMEDVTSFMEMRLL